MGLLLRLTHIWPFWDKEHLGGHSIMLAIAPAGQEGPFTWMDMFLWACHSSATDIYRVSAAMGRELGLTKPKRLLDSFSLFLSIELHEVWTCFSLHVCFSLSLFTHTHLQSPCLCCPTVSNSSGFVPRQHWL